MKINSVLGIHTSGTINFKIAGADKGARNTATGIALATLSSL